MPKRFDWSSDLLSIGFFAPLVMTARLQRLVLEGTRPSANGRREALRMSGEKPLASMEVGFAVQRQLFEAAVKFWSEMLVASNALVMSAPVVTAASTAPVRRRVRANARRLTGY